MSDPLTPTHWAVSRWGSSPYSGGSWSYLRPGGSPDDRAALGEPIAGRLIIAGEAVHRTRPAMVHGAYETGRAAALWCGDAESVIIVGAGAAGIGAAEMLGDRCIVVEGRDRIGGRTHTVDIGGVCADLGAAWMQQYGDNVIATKACSYGIDSVATDFHRPIVRAVVDGTAVDIDEDYRGLKSAYADFIAGRYGVDHDGSGHLDSNSWLGSLDASIRPAAERMIEGDIIIEAGAPASEISSKWVFIEPGVGEGDQWLPTGYLDVFGRLLDGIDVRTNWPVSRIDYGDHGVTAAGPNGALSADRIIVTVPVGVLHSGTIVFEPPLPDRHRLSLERIGIGIVEKVILRFPQRWWPHDDNGYFRWFDEPTNLVEWLDLTDHVGAPVVAGLISAPHTCGWYDNSSDLDIALRATRALSRFAGV